MKSVLLLCCAATIARASQDVRILDLCQKQCNSTQNSSEFVSSWLSLETITNELVSTFNPFLKGCHLAKSPKELHNAFFQTIAPFCAKFFYGRMEQIVYASPSGYDLLSGILRNNVAFLHKQMFLFENVTEEETCLWNCVQRECAPSLKGVSIALRLPKKWTCFVARGREWGPEFAIVPIEAMDPPGSLTGFLKGAHLNPITAIYAPFKNDSVDFGKTSGERSVFALDLFERLHAETMPCLLMINNFNVASDYSGKEADDDLDFNFDEGARVTISSSNLTDVEPPRTCECPQLHPDILGPCYGSFALGAFFAIFVTITTTCLLVKRRIICRCSGCRRNQSGEDILLPKRREFVHEYRSAVETRCNGGDECSDNCDDVATQLPDPPNLALETEPFVN